MLPLLQALPPAVHGQSLVWHFDGTGPALAADSSGHAHNGIIAGNVKGGAPGVSGAACTGFTSEGSYVYCDDQALRLHSADATLVLWLKNPGAADRNLIAGEGTNDKGNRAFELWVSAPDGGNRRTLDLTYGNWNGGVANFTSKPFVWRAGVWYQLAFVWRHENGNTYSFAVYLTAKGDAVGAPLFAGRTPGRPDGPGPAITKVFYVGGHGAGWSDNVSPPQRTGAFSGGYFGGEIDEVSFWSGRALTPQELADSGRVVTGPFSPAS